MSLIMMSDHHTVGSGHKPRTMVVKLVHAVVANPTVAASWWAIDVALVYMTHRINTTCHTTQLLNPPFPFQVDSLATQACLCESVNVFMHV